MIKFHIRIQVPGVRSARVYKAEYKDGSFSVAAGVHASRHISSAIEDYMNNLPEPATKDILARVSNADHSNIIDAQIYYPVTT